MPGKNGNKHMTMVYFNFLPVMFKDMKYFLEKYSLYARTITYLTNSLSKFTHSNKSECFRNFKLYQIALLH